MGSSVVVITGASAGVGRALAREYGARRARIGLIARGRDRLEATRREVEALGGQAVVCCADVGNADEFRRVTDVTYLGVVYGTLAALRRMRPRNSGAIVQVGSALAYRGIPLQSAYCAAVSLQVWATQHRGELAAMAGLLGVGLVARARARSAR